MRAQRARCTPPPSLSHCALIAPHTNQVQQRREKEIPTFAFFLCTLPTSESSFPQHHPPHLLTTPSTQSSRETLCRSLAFSVHFFFFARWLGFGRSCTPYAYTPLHTFQTLFFFVVLRNAKSNGCANLDVQRGRELRSREMDAGAAAASAAAVRPCARRWPTNAAACVAGVYHRFHSRYLRPWYNAPLTPSTAMPPAGMN